MGPKKGPQKQQQQKGKGKNASGKAGDATGGGSSKNKGAAQVQISSENERKLRQLLQNTGNLSSGVAKQQEELSVGQKKSAGRRLRNIYDTLLSEGFSSSQIEQALAALSIGGATLEAALDWLCMNLPANELPIKFSSGFRVEETEGGSIQVLAAARPDWAPAVKQHDDEERNALHSSTIPEPAPIVKEKKPEKDVQAEQAEWIKRYLAQQEEASGSESDEEESGDSDWEVFADPSEQNRRKEKRQVVDPRTRSISLATEFQKAKQAAAQAKERGDKEKQKAAGRVIRELRQEMTSLGLSESALNQMVTRDPFVGLGNAAFPSLGETTNAAAFPSLGESRNAAFPSLGDTKSARAPDQGHNNSLGLSFADLMRGKKSAPPAAAKPAVSNMVNLSKARKLPDWATAAVEESPQVSKSVSDEDSNDDAEGILPTFPEAEEDSLGQRLASEPSQDTERPTALESVETELKDHARFIDAVDNLEEETEQSTEPVETSHSTEAQQEVKLSNKEAEPVTEEDGDMLGMFDEESASEQSLPESVLSIQKKEKLTAWGMENAGPRRKTVAMNKKASQQTSQEEFLRQPKAVLQQHCQKNGWAAPKYEKLSTKGKLYAYTVTVTRPTVGRGKNKIVGGPVLCKLPEKEDYFESISDAQNAVATWALSILLPDLPVHHILPEPYRTMCLRWHTSGQNARKEMKREEEVRRASFVDSLVNSSISSDTTMDMPTTSEQSSDEERELVDSQKTVAKSTALDNKIKFRKEAESRDLKRRHEENLRTNNYQAMLTARAGLPMAAVKDDFLKKVRESEVVVVSGETGCGKTTQVPQYLLDEMIGAGRGAFCNIICTQPRRIAAISVAERVAVERCEPSPGTSGSLVGYQVRLDTAWNAGTKLLFCTTGILLRRLGGDRDLDGVSHIVVDEVHERTVLGDFLLVILKDLLDRRRESGFPLKIILMSATLDSELFSQYFGGCPVIKAKGRTFPVTTHYLEDIHDRLQYRLATDSPAAMHYDYKGNKNKTAKNLVDSSRGRQNLVQSGWGDDQSLEDVPVNPLYDEDMYMEYSQRTRSNLARLNEDVIDYDLIEDLIIHLDEEGEPGAILVFLPGMAEIQLLWDRLAVSRRFSGSASEWLLPLHSSVASSDQKRVFQTPPKGHRKVVLATNIAETSITIDDVVHVIDAGKHKENRFNPRRGMSSMVEAWISQANAKQRSGRAGRVQAGNCFCLYTGNRFEKLLRPFQLPEILRVPLVELCLQIKLLRLGSISSFLERALEPPKADAVQSAISTLRQVGALDEAEVLTSLGYHLASLPVDVRVGKMLLFGAVLGCLSPVLTIAACLSNKSPFISPQDQREASERAKQLLVADKGQDGTAANIASGQQSDHLAMVAAYDGWNTLASLKGARAAREYCTNNFLSGPTLTMLRDMRNQFASLLADIGFIRVPEADKGKRSGKIESLVNDPQLLFNRNAHLPSVVKAALCAGLYPNVAAMEEDSVRAGHASALSRRAGLSSGQRAHWSDGRREVFIHPTSINHKVAEFRQPFIVFHEKVETSRVYLRDTSVISPYALLLFGGAINVQHQTGRVTVDTWLEMNSPAQTGVLFKNLRAALDSLLDEHIRAPQGTISANTEEVINSIAQLLVDEEKVQL
ncbi:unnamed protein product [Calypogeia fissa]